MYNDFFVNLPLKDGSSKKDFRSLRASAGLLGYIVTQKFF